MANNRSIELADLPLDIYSKAMPAAGVPDMQVTAVLGALSSTCRLFNNNLKQELTDRAIIKQLWQAVIDDQRQEVIKLSQERPDLFFWAITQPAPKGFVIENNKQTFRKFDLEGKSLLTAMVTLKQMEMIKTLCKPFEKNEFKNQVIKKATKSALDQWVYYDVVVDADGNEEIDIPLEYRSLAQSLLDVFLAETLPNGVPGNYDMALKRTIPMDVRLSEPTESALTNLLDRLVPEHAMKLDECMDVELFLLVLYTTVRNHIRAANVMNRTITNDEWDKLDILCVRAIGLTQGALISETAEVFCEGLVNLAAAIGKGLEKKIGDNAARHIMQCGDRFYREGRNVRSGIGFHFLCGIFGRRTPTASWDARTSVVAEPRLDFTTIMSSKSNECLEITRRLRVLQQSKPDQLQLNRSLPPVAKF